MKYMNLLYKTQDQRKKHHIQELLTHSNKILITTKININKKNYYEQNNKRRSKKDTSRAK